MKINVVGNWNHCFIHNILQWNAVQLISSKIVFGVRNILIIHSHLYLDVCCKYLNEGWRQKKILLGLPPSHCSNSHCARGLSWSWLHLWGTMMSSSLETHYCSHFVRSFYSRNRHTRALWTLCAGLQSWVLLILLFASALQKSYLNICKSTKVSHGVEKTRFVCRHISGNKVGSIVTQILSNIFNIHKLCCEKLCRHRTLKQ